MPMILPFIIVAIILVFVIIYRSNVGEETYKFVKKQGGRLYSKVAPYTYKEIRKHRTGCILENTVADYGGQYD